LREVGAGGRIILKLIFDKCGVKKIRLNRIRIGSNGELL